MVTIYLVKRRGQAFQTEGIARANAQPARGPPVARKKHGGVVRDELGHSGRGVVMGACSPS